VPVSSIVVVLSPEPEARQQALLALGADPRVTLGPMERDRLAVVPESSGTPPVTAHLARLGAGFQSGVQTHGVRNGQGHAR